MIESKYIACLWPQVPHKSMANQWKIALGEDLSIYEHMHFRHYYCHLASCMNKCTLMNNTLVSIIILQGIEMSL